MKKLIKKRWFGGDLRWRNGGIILAVRDEYFVVAARGLYPVHGQVEHATMFEATASCTRRRSTDGALKIVIHVLSGGWGDQQTIFHGFSFRHFAIIDRPRHKLTFALRPAGRKRPMPWRAERASGWEGRFVGPMRRALLCVCCAGGRLGWSVSRRVHVTSRVRIDCGQQTMHIP